MYDSKNYLPTIEFEVYVKMSDYQIKEGQEIRIECVRYFGKMNIVFERNFSRK